MRRKIPRTRSSSSSRMFSVTSSSSRWGESLVSARIPATVPARSPVLNCDAKRLTAMRMPPAQQRLGADQLPVAQADLRLVVELELGIAPRLLELGGEQQPLLEI